MNTISSTALTPTEKILQKRIEDLLYERQNHQQQLEEVLATVDQLQSLVTNFNDQQDEVDELRERITLKEERIQQMRNEASQRRFEFKTTIECLEESSNRAIETYENRIAELEAQLEMYMSGKSEDDLLFSLQQERDYALNQVEILQERVDTLMKQKANSSTANEKLSHMESSSPTLTNASFESPKRGKGSNDLPENHPQRRQTLEFYEIEIEVLREKVEKLQALSDEKDFYISKLEKSLDRNDTTPVPSDEKLSNYAAEKENLVSRISELEHTIEQLTINNERDNERMSPAEFELETTQEVEENDSDSHDDEETWCEVCETNNHSLQECPTVFGSTDEA